MTEYSGNLLSALNSNLLKKILNPRRLPFETGWAASCMFFVPPPSVAERTPIHPLKLPLRAHIFLTTPVSRELLPTIPRKTKPKPWRGRRLLLIPGHSYTLNRSTRCPRLTGHSQIARSRMRPCEMSCVLESPLYLPLRTTDRQHCRLLALVRFTTCSQPRRLRRCSQARPRSLPSGGALVFYLSYHETPPRRTYRQTDLRPLNLLLRLRLRKAT